MQGLEHFEEAVTHYQEVVRQDLDNADAHYNLGLCLAALGRFQDAAEHLRHVLRLNPEDTAAREKLRQVEVQRRQRSEETN